MTRWRLGALAALLLLVGAPLALPFLELFHGIDRELRLAGNTVLLVGGTVLLSLPAGTALAMLLYRTDLPLRTALRSLTGVAMLVPLAVYTAAWQAVVGAGGWLATVVVDQPSQAVWPDGIGLAIWIHALAAMPWVAVIVGLGMSWVEPELEEDALLAMGTWRVLW